MIMRSSNPALTDRVFLDKVGEKRYEDDVMTIQGTVNKSFILIAILLLASYFPWKIAMSGDFKTTQMLMFVGIGGGLVTALITIFKKTASSVTVPIYAAFEGLAIGGISAVYEMQFPGIVFNAISLTVMVFLALLFAYKSGFIKATENFKLGVAAATGGIALVYLLTFILSFFGIQMPFIHDSGPIGIGVSLFICVIAALNLVMDFDFIENGADAKAPKYMEWYASFGLLVTLIWLYLEILRLLSKLSSRD